MKQINYSELGNSEIKMHIENLKNEFEGKKLHLKEICDEMNEIEQEFMRASHELKIRRNLYL